MEGIKGWCVEINTGKVYYQKYGNNAMYNSYSVQLGIVESLK